MHRRRSQTPWLWFFVIGAIYEDIGWCGRLASHWCAYGGTLFEMQISALIGGKLFRPTSSHLVLVSDDVTAPAFTQAGIYIITYSFIALLGRSTSPLPLPPKVYLWTFLAIDVTCLVLQAVGGGLASSAFGRDADPKVGTNIMVGGIIAQLVFTILFGFVLFIVLWRGRAQIKPSKPLTALSAATSTAVLCMIARGVYRAIELAQGWRGELITNEVYFCVLDGALMLIAVGIFNFWNPGTLLERERAARGEEQVPSPVADEEKTRPGDSSSSE